MAWTKIVVLDTVKGGKIWMYFDSRINSNCWFLSHFSDKATTLDLSKCPFSESLHPSCWTLLELPHHIVIINIHDLYTKMSPPMLTRNPSLIFFCVFHSSSKMPVLNETHCPQTWSQLPLFFPNTSPIPFPFLCTLQR